MERVHGRVHEEGSLEGFMRMACGEGSLGVIRSIYGWGGFAWRVHEKGLLEGFMRRVHKEQHNALQCEWTY